MGWGGPKGMLAPSLKLLGGTPPPLPTPMITPSWDPRHKYVNDVSHSVPTAVLELFEGSGELSGLSPGLPRYQSGF